MGQWKGSVDRDDDGELVALVARCAAEHQDRPATPDGNELAAAQHLDLTGRVALQFNPVAARKIDRSFGAGADLGRTLADTAVALKAEHRPQRGLVGRKL